MIKDQVPPTPVHELSKLLPFSKKEPLETLQNKQTKKTNTVDLNLQKLLCGLETYISLSEVLLVLTNLHRI